MLPFIIVPAGCTVIIFQLFTPQHKVTWVPSVTWYLISTMLPRDTSEHNNNVIQVKYLRINNSDLKG